MATSGLALTVDWWSRDKVPLRVRRKVERMLQACAPQINEFEAHLYDMHVRASNGLDWLMPKIELTVPVYEEGMVFRLRLLRLEETQMVLETRKGEAVAEVVLR